MTQLYQQMRSSSAMLWATPVYYWSPPVSLKTVIDRMFPWGEWQETRHARALDGKPVGLVITYADAEAAESGYYHTFHIMKAAIESSGGRCMGSVHTAAPNKGDVLQQPSVLAAARKLGEQLYAEARSS